MVICDQWDTCEQAWQCGGAIPHMECSECGNCPYDESAECIEYKEEDSGPHMETKDKNGNL